MRGEKREAKKEKMATRKNDEKLAARTRERRRCSVLGEKGEERKGKERVKDGKGECEIRIGRRAGSSEKEWYG